MLDDKNSPIGFQSMMWMRMKDLCTCQRPLENFQRTRGKDATGGMNRPCSKNRMQWASCILSALQKMFTSTSQARFQKTIKKEQGPKSKYELLFINRCPNELQENGKNWSQKPKMINMEISNHIFLSGRFPFGQCPTKWNTVWKVSFLRSYIGRRYFPPFPFSRRNLSRYEIFSTNNMIGEYPMD